jgi:hypothetical protein
LISNASGAAKNPPTGKLLPRSFSSENFVQVGFFAAGLFHRKKSNHDKPFVSQGICPLRNKFQRLGIAAAKAFPSGGIFICPGATR